MGIGASAGGLAAFETFFAAMPAETDSGMAFVLVQHLAPDHESVLADLVKRYTEMSVRLVEHGMTVEPGCAYIIPPNRDMALLNGALQLLEQTAPRGHQLPIDFFFRSLAQDKKEQAICIVLSGTGSDGALGVRAVKGEGGMVIAQTPESSAYDGMPRSAIATGMVDYVLEPAEIPARLIGYARHAFGGAPAPTAASTLDTDDTLIKVCVLLRAQTGHDFSHYKVNTVARRVRRRMALHQVEAPTEYLRFLQNNPREVEALFRDLLIGVTSFFRDADAFEALEETVIPRLLGENPAGVELRVWVAGCSTGEEAYSLAMLIHEQIDILDLPVNLRLFATDIDRRGIEHARAGVFPPTISADVSAKRLSRFFEQDADGGVYRVRKSIRDSVIFSEQDVIKDPPFSRLDLISCRNVMIYMDGALQKKLIPLFHYALNPRGVLLLGPSETVGDATALFAPVDRKWRVYEKQAEVPGADGPSFRSIVSGSTRAAAPPAVRRQGLPTEDTISLARVTEQSLLDHYAQAAVLVNRRGEILHIHGRTGSFLEPAPGDAKMNVLTMARDGLRRELSTGLHRVVGREESVQYTGLRVRTNGDHIFVDLTLGRAVQKADGAAMTDLFLIIFEERPPTESRDTGDADDADTDAEPPSADIDARLATFEQELRVKEEYLQTTIEEMETSNEELKSTNEEMQSVNEELQSTNEELETSKEELQSVNEELTTVNTELQNKVTELSRSNNDMNNLLAGTGVGTLFVDHQLCITRFTPATTQVMNLIQSDVGRPLAHTVSNLVGYDQLVEDLQTVLENLAPIEREVETKAGNWQLMRLRPYRTLENVIEGAVITFVDITRQKRAELATERALTLADTIIDTVREPMLVLDADLRVVRANGSFCRVFAVSKAETEGHLVFELGNRQWDIPELRRLLEEIVPKQNSFDDFEVSHEFESIGRRMLMLNARLVRPRDKDGELVLLAIEDVTPPDPSSRLGDA